MTRATARRRGLSTVEATISMVIVGVMLVASLSTLGAAARSREAQADRVKGVALAEELMAEILAQRYEEPELTSGAESLLSSHDTAGVSDFDVSDDAFVGQYFKPTCPVGTTSWSVTRVRIKPLQKGADGGLSTRLQLRRANADMTPQLTIVEQQLVDESSLPAEVSAYTWLEYTFTNAGGLEPGEGLCLVLVTDDAEVAAQAAYDSGGVAKADSALVTSGDGGLSWDVEVDEALVYEIHGVFSVATDPDALGPEAPELATSRADWDDVDDYDKWKSAPPVTRDGTPIPDTTGWERDVKVFHADPGTLAFVGTRTGLKMVLVKAVAPDGREFKAMALRSDAGAQEQPFALDAGFVTDVEIELQLAKDPPAEAAVTLVNNVFGAP